jgi:hypothetical protein
MHDERQIPVWFFIGGLLLIYGVLITGYGLIALLFPPPPESRVALYELHPDIWWGAVMTIFGVYYCVRYNPFRETAG